MKIPTCSKLDRVIRCPLSELLPHTPDAPTTHTTAGADRHERVAEVLSGDAPRDSIPWNVHEVLGLPPDAEMHVECALSFSFLTDTSAHIGDNLKRAYPRDPGALYGTADIVAVLADRVVVVDWKGGHAWLPDAAENWQLRALAMMACDAFKRDRATIATVRLHDHGCGKPDVAELDASDNADTLADVTNAMNIIQIAESSPINSRPAPRPGEWCRYCPGRNSCPAFDASARELQTIAGDGAWLERMRVEIERDPGRVYEFAERGKKILAEVWKLLEYRADTGGCFALPDGSTVERVSEERRSIDATKAIDVLRSVGAEDAVELSVTVGAIERTLRERNPARGAALPVIRDTMRALETCGALKTSGMRKWKRTTANGGSR